MRCDSVTASRGNPCRPRGSRPLTLAVRLPEATPQTVVQQGAARLSVPRSLHRVSANTIGAVGGNERTRLLAVLVVAVLATSLLAACGNSGSGGGTEQFRGQTEDPVLEFGAEGSEAELAQAEETVREFLLARSEGNWEAACARLSASMVAKLEHLAGSSTSLSDTSCPSFLEAFVRLPQSEKNETTVDDGGLRQEGAKGYLVYFGAGHAIYAMPLDRDGDAWGPAAISPKRLS